MPSVRGGASASHGLGPSMDISDGGDTDHGFILPRVEMVVFAQG